MDKKLNILLVNTFYYGRGGAPIYGIRLEKLLHQRGHNVLQFAMKSSHNLPSPYEKYFVDHIDFVEELRQFRPHNALRVLTRTFHFSQARKNMEQLLDENPVDIVHLNNFLHHITLSIIEPIRRRGIPIVWTLHDHILVCPNTNLYDDRLGAPCERCRSTFGRFVNPIIRRCKKGSLAASAIAAAEALYIAAHKPAKIPKFFIAPSQFLLNQHRKMGFDVSRFVVVPNFVEVDQFEPHFGGDYVLYFGRLSPEKGVDVLIRAMAKLPHIPLVIAGTGPQEKALKSLASQTGANVRFTGFLSGNELKEAIYGARFTVLPSVCFENSPLSVMESFAAGKPVIGTNLGGIPELVSEDVGILVPPGDVDALAEAISTLWHNEPAVLKMGRNARALAEEKFTTQKHLEKILEIYRAAVAGV